MSQQIHNTKNIVENALKNSKDLAVNGRVTYGENNQPAVELIAYGESGEKQGSIFISPDEARIFGIDVNTMYEPKEVDNIKQVLKTNYNKTSKGNPASIQTYLNGGYYFDDDLGNFPRLNSKGYDVKANISFDNNKYYPHIFINDGENMFVKTLPGSEDLNGVYNALQQNVDDNLVKQLIIENNARK